jgi:hypothetical protein
MPRDLRPGDVLTEDGGAEEAKPDLLLVRDDMLIDEIPQ